MIDVKFELNSSGSQLCIQIYGFRTSSTLIIFILFINKLWLMSRYQEIYISLLVPDGAILVNHAGAVLVYHDGAVLVYHDGAVLVYHEPSDLRA